ncbi:hypothetical protein RFI_12712 [Reticulomyxa filosa]|uniref:Uncharacterized protein n=1 Tax=Reticulomyxa filosa TaxID=46433 RepID=X6NDQ6_RETFI|nr:hypothetical protein RFI_12712 [Reticulomyxa filosa]|eukprot:ETO24445.1 hypothetical protein RFI_12712 [Reticulomyxa filosa]
MHLNEYKAGFETKWGLIAVLVVNSFCSVYCAWLLYVTHGLLWRCSMPNFRDVPSAVEVQNASHTEMRELSVSVSIEEKRPTRNLNKKIRWVVTLYILSCILFFIGGMCERLVYALADVPGRVCSQMLYVSYLRILIEGFFFAFYVVRATVLLQKTTLAISKMCQFFLGIVPVFTFGALITALHLYLHFTDCDVSQYISRVLALSLVVCHFFWDVSLFVFLAYYLHKIINKKELSTEIYQNDLKGYMKKLLRLFIIAELSSFAVYICFLTPAWLDLAWSIIPIDLCFVRPTSKIQIFLSYFFFKRKLMMLFALKICVLFQTFWEKIKQ